MFIDWMRRSCHPVRGDLLLHHWDIALLGECSAFCARWSIKMALLRSAAPRRTMERKTAVRSLRPEDRLFIGLPGG